MTGIFGGKVVFLTGAGSVTGIGRATALAFAREGARIAANDVTTDDLAETVALLRAAGAEAEAFPADVSQADAVQKAVAYATERFGQIDILVSNAGIAKKKAFVALSDVEWRRTHRRQPRRGHVLRSCRRAPDDRSRQRAHHQPLIADGRMVGVVRARSLQRCESRDRRAHAWTGDGIGPARVTVNAVAPGFVRTAQSMSVEHSVGPEGLKLVAPYVPLRRIGDPEDIAGSCSSWPRTRHGI